MLRSSLIIGLHRKSVHQVLVCWKHTLRDLHIPRIQLQGGRFFLDRQAP